MKRNQPSLKVFTMKLPRTGPESAKVPKGLKGPRGSL